MTKRTMGPIERELRQHDLQDIYEIEREAFLVLLDANVSLGLGSAMLVEKQRFWPDIFSEAIEAAEALNL